MASGATSWGTVSTDMPQPPSKTKVRKPHRKEEVTESATSATGHDAQVCEQCQVWAIWGSVEQWGFARNREESMPHFLVTGSTHLSCRGNKEESTPYFPLTGSSPPSVAMAETLRHVSVPKHYKQSSAQECSLSITSTTGQILEMEASSRTFWQ